MSMHVSMHTPTQMSPQRNSLILLGAVGIVCTHACTHATHVSPHEGIQTIQILLIRLRVMLIHTVHPCAGLVFRAHAGQEQMHHQLHRCCRRDQARTRPPLLHGDDSIGPDRTGHGAEQDVQAPGSGVRNPLVEFRTLQDRQPETQPRD